MFFFIKYGIILMEDIMNLKEIAIEKLNKRGVTIDDMAALALEVQSKYNNDLTIEDCRAALLMVLEKREVTHAILTGIAIDEAVEKKLFDPEINDIILEDKPLYGIDEILALSIVNVYGSIALTNFGYLDKLKPGIIGVVDKYGKHNNGCSTFLDDIVGALVAATISRIAHK
jgi:phosphatidylglycerophosphatase A